MQRGSTWVMILALTILSSGQSSAVKIEDSKGRAIEADIIKADKETVTIKRANGEKIFTLKRNTLSPDSNTLIDGFLKNREEGPSAPAVESKEGEVVKWAKTAYERNEKIKKEIADDLEGKRPLSNPDQPLDELLAPVLEAADRMKALLAELAGGELKDQAERLQDILSDEQPELGEFWEKAMLRDMQSENLQRLKSIGLLLWEYTDEIDGNFPESLESIPPEFRGSVPLVDSWGSPFIYLGKGVTRRAPANTPIAVQNPKGQDKVAVLSLDGAVRFLRVPASGAVFNHPFQDLNKRLK